MHAAQCYLQPPYAFHLSACSRREAARCTAMAKPAHGAGCGHWHRHREEGKINDAALTSAWIAQSRKAPQQQQHPQQSAHNQVCRHSCMTPQSRPPPCSSFYWPPTHPCSMTSSVCVGVHAPDRCRGGPTPPCSRCATRTAWRFCRGGWLGRSE
jgi:hypothetical protein